ncbi:MAG: isoprenylcysteine carboxylmethyltransferase family protein [Rickettsiales bacterium]
MTGYLYNPKFIAYGDLLFKRRNRIFPVFLICLFLAFKPRGPESLLWVGLAVTVAGQILRMAVIGFAYIKRGGLNKKVYADTLVTGGFFGACRNPLYVGNVLILGGLLLMHGNPFVLTIGAAFFLTGYQAIVATEENFLRNKFDAKYREYCAGVPRWRIRFERLPQILRGMEFNWRKVVYNDYSTAAGWGTQALALCAYREYCASGRASVHWLYAMLGLASCTLLIRLVKKTFPLRTYV